MEDNRRLLLAAVLSVVVVVGWQFLFPAPKPAPPPAPAVIAEPAVVPSGTVAPPAGTALPVAPTQQGADAPGQQGAGALGANSTQPAEALAAIEGAAEERVALETDAFTAEFSNRGAQLVSLRLKGHREHGGEAVELVRQRVGISYPFGLVDAAGAELPLGGALFAVSREPGPAGEPSVTFEYNGVLGRAKKTFRITSAGLLGVEIEADPATPWRVLFGPGARQPALNAQESSFDRRSGVYLVADSVEEVAAAKAKEDTSLSGAGVTWVGLEDTYFLAAVVPRVSVEQLVFTPRLVTPSGEGQRFSALPTGGLSTEQKDLQRELLLLVEPRGGKFAADVFLGAKDYEQLAALPNGLERTVRFGTYLGFLAKWLLVGLKWLYANVVANYGWTIVLMTILIRIVMFPLTHKQMASAKKMQDLNPKVQAIRNKYNGKLRDKKGGINIESQRKMSEEIGALYKSAGVNPLGGCFPILLQFPVLVAFYNLLANAVELRNAPWLGWVVDLASKDPYYVLPLVMGATQFLQTLMMPAVGDPMQRKIFLLMPVVFTVMFLSFPSGLVLYWLTNNVLSIVQQWAYNKFSGNQLAPA